MVAFELGSRARRAARVVESEGQPSAARLEPGPFEVAEQERGERDDVVREGMAEQAAEGGRAEGLALPVGSQELSILGDSTLKLYRLLSGQYNYDRLITGTIAGEAAEQFVARVKVDAGKLFIVRRVAVLAPKGSKLRLYKNSQVAGSFVEVVTAVQEYSGEVPGTLRLRGTEHLLATVLGAEAAGGVTVHLEGDLVNQEYFPW